MAGFGRAAFWFRREDETTFGQSDRQERSPILLGGEFHSSAKIAVGSVRVPGGSHGIVHGGDDSLFEAVISRRIEDFLVDDRYDVVDQGAGLFGAEREWALPGEAVGLGAF